MKTEITRVSETLLRLLQPLPAAIATAQERLAGRGEFGSAQRDVEVAQMRLRALTQKLGNEHAHLLIFGPLKSGKSTLMNAISGAYVSEVSALPGYPALVFVQHAETASISATRYNGRESVFTDTHVLKDVIADSHIALAGQIREAEEKGEEFDPRRHFNEAIRRIDIRMPVKTLAESGTVLVDTPGLYSRMNFGYDILTREFRDTAACAVFVVKADNLFLEQVFTEFNQLLELFSRVFLVVNVDSRKCDLQPDGTLAPSAESVDPRRIVEAFKTLSMARQLREAHAQGRVRIHAVDLMQAASAVLSRASRGEAVEGSAGEAFESFRRDLTEYLDGTEYTREFISDSLRQSNAICETLISACTGSDVAMLRAQQEALAKEIAALDARLAAYDRLLAVDWRGTFTDVRVATVKRIARASEKQIDELRAALEVALERWFESNHGLRSLEHQFWNPIIRKAGATLTEEAIRHVRAVVATPLGGAEPDDAVQEDLSFLDLDFTVSAKSALKVLTSIESTEPFRVPIKPQEVPVKKTTADWMAFRSNEAVAVRFFGEDRLQTIPVEAKRQRLQDESRTAFLRAIESALDERFPEAPTRAVSQQLERYIDKLCEGIARDLTERRSKVERKRAEKRRPFDDNQQLAEVLKLLHEQAVAVQNETHELARREKVLPLGPAPLEALPFPQVVRREIAG